MKKTMHKYLFSDPVDGKDASKYALERVLENSDTAGVLKEMKEEISSGLLNTDPKRNSKPASSDSMDLKLENLEAKISVGKENHKTDYTFHFVFVDNENDDKWDCLKKPEKSK